MYISWTGNVVLWRIFLGFISDLNNALMMHNYGVWVWVQSRRSKSSICVVTFSESFFF